MAGWRQYLAMASVLTLTGWGLQGAGCGENARNGGPASTQPLPPAVIVLDPPLMEMPQVSEFTVTVTLPVVNDGFANDADVKGPIKPVVEALRSPVFGERESANLAPLRLPPGRLGEVVEALSRETDAEAIERLTQVAAHLFLKPRTLLRTKASLLGVWFEEPSLSMLGIKFKMDPVKLTPQDASPTMTVMVTEIQPGFPALQTLRNGDRIVALGGVGFPPNIPPEDSDYFRSRVASLWPGGVVAMTILRDGKLMELGVQITGLPVDGPSSPAAMVNMRTAALEAFLRTLKTGDKSQVRLMKMPSPDEWNELPPEYRSVLIFNPWEGSWVPVMSGSGNYQRN